MEKIIVAHRGDRLGARLIPMLSAIRIAKAADLDFRFTWPLIHGRDYEVNNFQDLFAEEFLERCISPQEMRSKSLLPVQAEHGTTLGEFRELLDGYDGAIVKHTGCCVFQGENESDIRAEMPDAFAGIGFQPKLKDAISALTEKMQSRKMLALHVRRGDLRLPYLRWLINWTLPGMGYMPDTKYVPTCVYEKFIEQNQGAEFDEIVLFSDDDDLIARLAAKYSFVRTPTSLYDRGDYSDIQTALLDLALMSKCSAVVAPGFSAFSNTASMIGNVGLKKLVSAFEPSQIIRIITDDLSESILTIDSGTKNDKIDFALDTTFLVSNGREHCPVDKAEQFLEKSLELDTDNVGAQFLLADIYKQRGNYTDGALLINKAVFLLDFIGNDRAQVAMYYKYYVEYMIDLMFSDAKLNYPLRASPRSYLSYVERYAKKAVDIVYDPSQHNVPGQIYYYVLYVVTLIVGGKLGIARDFLSKANVLTEEQVDKVFLHVVWSVLFANDRLRTVAMERMRTATENPGLKDFASMMMAILQHRRNPKMARRTLAKEPGVVERYPWLPDVLKATPQETVDADS